MSLAERAEQAWLRIALNGITPEFPELDPKAAAMLITVSWIHTLRHISKIGGYSLPKKGAAIIAPNHEKEGDNFKICVAGTRVGRMIRAVAKKGLVVKGFRESEEYLKTIADETASLPYKPRNAYVLKGVGVIPVDREKPDREFLKQTDAVLEAEQILGIYIQPHRYKDCFLRNLQTGAAVIARRHPDVPVYPCASSSGHLPFKRDTLVILKPFTYRQKVEELGHKISVGEFTIMIADSIAQTQSRKVQEDWLTRRPKELARLTNS